MKKGIRIVASLLSIVMLFSLMAGCTGQTEETQQPSQPQQQESSSPTTPPEETPNTTVEYPTRAISMICAYAAGGSGDLALRAIAEPLSRILGQPVVVNNVTGGAGIPGHLEGVNADPDGYTILECAVSPMVITPYTSDTGYTYEDLQNIYCLAILPVALAVNKDSPFQTLQEFFDYSKEHPGELLAGNSGAGGVHHIALEMVNKKYGTGVTSVAYDGAATGNAALLGGNIDAMCISLTDVASYALSGDFRVLGIMSNERADMLPDVPTFKECGYDVTANVWFGISLPKETPKEIVDILADALDKAGKDESFLQTCETLKIIPAGYGPEEFTAMIAGEVEAYRPILEDLGLA